MGQPNTVTTSGLAVGAVIVNRNGGEYLRRCVTSLLAQTHSPDRIVVVDNASTDDSLRNLPPLNSSLEVIRLDHNAGFAAANNIAIQGLHGFEWIVLLNPDAFAEPDWLERLMEVAVAQPEYVCFASRMLMDVDPGHLDGAGDAYHCTGLVWRRGHCMVAQNRYLNPEEVFSPCAAAALYRRDAFMAAGGFDEGFFCYMEDVDLGFRLRLLGYRCGYVPGAVVRHVGSATTGRGSDFSVYHGHRNLVWAFVKNMPGPLLWLFLLPHVAMNLLMILRYVVEGQGGTVLKAKLDAVRGLSVVWRQRREIQRQRTASLTALLRVMSFGWPRAERFFHG